MDEKQIFEQVSELIAMQLGVDAGSITMDSRMVEDLKADSANIIMLVMDLEDKFNIAVEDDAIMDIKTVGDVVRGIKGMIG